VTKWLRRIRGAVATGLVWAVGWAIAGVLIGVASVLLPGLPWDAFFEIFNAPLPTLAVPGFFGGVIFSAVLGIAGHRRSFDELSVRRFAAWGAVGGVLLSLVPAAMVTVGLAMVTRESFALWQLTAVISVPLALLSAASASGSLIVARKAQPEKLPAPGGRLADAGLAHGKAREVLGRRE
jgi:hypothetical protein